jgi:proline racemase
VRTLGLSVEPRALPELITLQRELRPALDTGLDVVHPTQANLAGIYGVIFWQPVEGEPRTQRNVTVFADGEVDRSPCGSGTSARLAILYDRGDIRVGETLHHRSIVDSAFDARVIEAGPPVGGHPTVITDVEGAAFRTGQHTFSLDDRDPLGRGFLLR